MLESLKAYLSGKKTYLVSAGGVLLTLAGWSSGEVGLFEAINTILGFLGLGTLRAGIAKSLS